MELGTDVVKAALADWRTAPLREPMRLMLGFLQKLIREPDSVGAADVAPLREVGISDAAMEDAICVCAAFGVINRIADAMEFHVPTDAQFARAAPIMLRRGYKFA